MGKILIEVNTEQIEKAIRKLPIREQIKIGNKIWESQMDRFVKKMRNFAQKNEITSKKIKEICEETRKKLYEKRVKGSD